MMLRGSMCARGKCRVAGARGKNVPPCGMLPAIDLGARLASHPSHIRSMHLVIMPLLAGVGGCAAGKTVLPAPPGATAYFAGGSVDDVWAFTWEMGAAHWDGDTW